MNLDLLSAFVIGLLGSGHCLVMCGGITTMLTSAIDTQKKNSTMTINHYGDIPTTSPAASSQCATAINTTDGIRLNRALLICFYHLGRILSYSLIGAIVGLTGSIAAKNLGLPITGLRLIAAIFLILLGLYIGQWLFWLNKIEQIGKGLWQFLSPLSKHVIPVNSHKKALGLGALWGWLPCGLIYSTLTWALASGDSLTGASIMLFFGLGTLPALLTVSLGFISFKKLLAQAVFRQLIAVALITYGIYGFIVAYTVMF